MPFGAGFRHGYTWMRFGFSPDWYGHSPYGFGPVAHQAMYGIMPAPPTNYYPRTRYTPPGEQMNVLPMPGFPMPYDYGAVQVTLEQTLNILKQQTEILTDELEAVREQIKVLESEKNRR